MARGILRAAAAVDRDQEADHCLDMGKYGRSADACRLLAFHTGAFQQAVWAVLRGREGSEARAATDDQFLEFPICRKVVPGRWSGRWAQAVSSFIA
jgi:hypothetical protein